MQFIDLNSQYSLLKSKIDSRIQQVLNHGAYINGPEVNELEIRLQEFLNVKNAITCANGTDALVLGLLALDVQQGDLVLCPAFTFFASAEAVAVCGATPVFVDCDPNTFNICPVSLEKTILELQARTLAIPKVILTVDLFGLPADYESIIKIAKKHNLKILEDAAQGFGGTINNVKACSFGDVSTTSFFPSKPLGCYGDGGAVFTNNDAYAQIIRSLAQHGKGVDKYDNIRIGMNSRLDTIQAAVLLEKLEVFPEEMALRNEIADRYHQMLGDYVITPAVPKGFISSWAQYTIRSEHRETIKSYLATRDIPSMIYYKKCLHQQKAFAELDSSVISPLDLNQSVQLSNQVLSLPMHPYVTDENIHIICESVKSSLS